MSTQKILVVDDSRTYQRLLSEIIEEHPMCEVVGVALNGEQALELIPQLKPDLVLLDIQMPEMNGIEALVEIRDRWPELNTIMISSITSGVADIVENAMAIGADDFISKLVSEGGGAKAREALSDLLLPKIETLCGLEHQRKTSASSSLLTTNEAKCRASKNSRKPPELLAIGVSTGGPDALAIVLKNLPADIGVPVVIVQHMPAEFTTRLADRLDKISALSVKEARMGDWLDAGNVYIAPGDYHMVVERKGLHTFIVLNTDPPENSVRPSVDPLFCSVAATYGDRCIGVILTGMGQDGLVGSKALFKAGASVLVQDEESCIVWGMPKLVAQAGLAEAQVPLSMMARRIYQSIHPDSEYRVPRHGGIA